MNAVYRRELKSNLFSMTGTIFIAFTLVFIGLYSAMNIFGNASAHFEYAIYSISFMSLLAVPVLTMRTFSEERQTKVDQLLYSLPLTTGEIVLGKFFALATIMAIPTVVMCLYPLIMASFCTAGAVNFALIYASIMCYFLLGCAVIAICMFLSSLTESQVISVVISLAAVLLMYFMSSLASMVSTSSAVSLVVVLAIAIVVAYIVWITLKNYVIAGITGGVLVVGSVVTYVVKSALFEGLAGKMLAAFAIFDPIINFINGIFDISTIIYYVSISALFIFFTVQCVEKRRWS